MSEKEQEEYKIETNKRPLYFNRPSNDFKKWLELKTEVERKFQEGKLKMSKRTTNTKQTNFSGKIIKNRISKRRRKYQISQKNTTIQISIIKFF